MKGEKIIVLLSGGLNSAVTLALALKQEYEVVALSIHYGQCHVRELRSAQLLVDHYCVEEYFISSLDMYPWTDSTLIDFQPSPLTQRFTLNRQNSSFYIPNLNLIFLSIALSLAEAKNAKRIYIGTDQSIELDCPNSRIIQDSGNLLNLSSMALQSDQNHLPLIDAPLRNYTKFDIMRLAVELDVPIDLTWSCCQYLSTPCGICSSCRRRNEALMAVGLSYLVTPMAKSYV